MSVAPIDTDVWRMVEVEANSQSRLLTDTQEEYDFLERYIDSGKPPYPLGKHHFLISTAFRYEAPTPPEYAARFKPPEGDSRAFYASLQPRTTFHEVAFHWLRERLHLPNPSQTPEPRTLFSVRFRDRNAYDIRTEPNNAELTSRYEHSASWQFIRSHPDVNSILYPSCRCPDRGVNVFTRDIATLDQNPKALVPFLLIFRPPSQACYIVSAHQDPKWPSLAIPWSEVG